MLFSLLERHGIDPAEAVMIGDSHADILAGKNAGLRTVLIAGEEAALAARPDRSTNNLSEAAAVISLWNT